MTRLISTLSLVGTLALAACSVPEAMADWAGSEAAPVVQVQTVDGLAASATADAGLIDANIVSAESRAIDSSAHRPLAVAVDTGQRQAFEADISTLESSNASLEQKLAEVQWMLRQARNDKTTLEAQLGAMNGDAQAVSRELAQKDAQMRQMAAQLEQAQSRAMQAEQEGVQMERALVRAQRSALAYEQDMNAQVQQMRAMEREISHLRHRASSNRAALEQLAATQAEADHLRRKLQNQRAKRQELQAQVDRLQNRLAHQRGQADRVAELEAKVQRLRGRLAEAQRGGGQVTALQQQLTQVEADLSRTRAANKRLRERVQSLQATNEVGKGRGQRLAGQ